MLRIVEMSTNAVKFLVIQNVRVTMWIDRRGIVTTLWVIVCFYRFEFKVGGGGSKIRAGGVVVWRCLPKISDFL